MIAFSLVIEQWKSGILNESSANHIHERFLISRWLDGAFGLRRIRMAGMLQRVLAGCKLVVGWLRGGGACFVGTTWAFMGVRHVCQKLASRLVRRVRLGLCSFKLVHGLGLQAAPLRFELGFLCGNLRAVRAAHQRGHQRQQRRTQRERGARDRCLVAYTRVVRDGFAHDAYQRTGALFVTTCVNFGWRNYMGACGRPARLGKKWYFPSLVTSLEARKARFLAQTSRLRGKCGESSDGKFDFLPKIGSKRYGHSESSKSCQFRLAEGTATEGDGAKGRR